MPYSYSIPIGFIPPADWRGFYYEDTNESSKGELKPPQPAFITVEELNKIIEEKLVTKEEWKELINLVKNLNKTTNQSLQNIADPKLDEKSQEELKYSNYNKLCERERQYKLLLSSSHCQSNDKNIFILSKIEYIRLGDTMIGKNPVLNSKGGSANASKMAIDFFQKTFTSTTLHYMNSRIFQNAILIRSGSLQTPLRYYDGEPSPLSETPVIATKFFKWSWSSLWEKGTSEQPEDVGKYGTLHTVVLVTSSNGQEVVVDWSFGQFARIDLMEARLYHPDF